jgi:type I restriction enzyme S subunit
MKQVSLGEVTNIQTGKIDVNKAVAGGKYPFFTCSREVYEIDDAPYEGKAVLVAGNGDLNVKYYEGKFNAYQRTYFLFVNDENVLLPKFLYWFLESYVEKLRSESIGSTIKYIKMGNLTDASFTLPSLEIQIQIVEKLDKAFAEIDSLEKNLQLKEEKTNQLLQSMLNAAFSNFGGSQNDVFISTIGQLCEIGDGNHSSKYPTKDEMISSGVPFIRAKNLINDDVDATDVIYISKRKHEDLLKGHIKKGDILLTNRGEIGKLAIVPAKFDGSNLNAQIAWLRCSDKIINRYLFLYLKSDLAKKLFISGTRGSALQQLTIGKLKSIEVPVLSLKNQQVIVDRLDKVFSEIDKLKAQTSIQKKSATALRQSILSKAFNFDEKVA